MARRTRYRRGRRRKRGFTSWSLGKKIAVVAGSTLIMVLAIGSVILASKMSKIETTKLDVDKLSISDEVEHETGYVNVALFGLDSRGNSLGKGNRSDTIIIASLNKENKEVKMVSVYRDTLLQMDDGSYNKANAAYSFGGPEGAISMLNKNMDMNIEKYVAVNFNALVDVIDAIGGLDITLTDAEVVHMNNYCVETSKVTGKSYEKIEPEVAGTYHLNGVQAVSYSRIRYTAGGDFERTERQRHVLELIAEKAQSMSLSTINKIIDDVFPQISTNFTLAEMIGYAKDFADYKIGDTMGFPDQNKLAMLNKVGSVVIPDTLSEGVKKVHEFLFGNDGYTVSSTVKEIENGIAVKSQEKASDNSSIDEEETYQYKKPDSGTSSSGKKNNSTTSGGTSSGNSSGSSGSGGNTSNNGSSDGEISGGETSGGDSGGGVTPEPTPTPEPGTGGGSDSDTTTE